MNQQNQIRRYELTGAVAQPHWLDLSPSYETSEVQAYWRTIRKHQWTIVTISLALFIFVLVGTLKQIPIFRARALIEIQKENPEIPTVQELFQLDSVSNSYLESQCNILKSKSLARRVIAQLQLDKRQEFNRPRGWWHKRRDFQDRLGIGLIPGSRSVEVSFESEDPVLAAQIVNALISNYIEQNMAMRWDATQKASSWLAQQLVGMKAKLEKSTEELQEYTQQNGVVFLETDKGALESIVNERIRKLQEELTKVQAARFEKESLYRHTQEDNFAFLPGELDYKPLQELQLRLGELQREQARLATKLGPKYPLVKQNQKQIDELESQLARERDRVAKGIADDYLAAVRREKLVRQTLEEQQKQANQLAQRWLQYNILKREVETNKQLYEGLLQRLKEAGVSAGLKASNLRIVDAAEPPKQPVRPKVPLNLALGLACGLTLGVVIAFLLERLDNTLKTSEEIERLLHVPALALIPAVGSLSPHRAGTFGLNGNHRKLLASGNAQIAGKLAAGWHRIDADSQQHSAMGEAFRNLRTSVLLSTAERAPRSLLVTSAQPGEGKTTISINLGISLAQLGLRVLLIDGDMRRPSIHKVFGIQASPGLASYLAGQQDWRAAVVPTGVASLDTLVCGSAPPNPAELLSSERMCRLVQEAMIEYQIVVADSPIVLNLADSRILAKMVEGVVLVVGYGATPRELVRLAYAHVRDVGANVIGAVLNNVNERSDEYYSASYGYSYSKRQEERG